MLTCRFCLSEIWCIVHL